MRIFKNLFNKKKYDIQFFCSCPIDEVWIRSTLFNFHLNKLKVQLSVCGDLDPKLKELYLNNNIEVIDGISNTFKKSASYECTFCITASSGINRNIYKTKAYKLIHMPHSLASFHMIYPEDAFFGYDEIFCSGPHHKAEVESLNKKYNMEISASEIGYGKFDLLQEDYKNYQINRTKKENSDKTKILIAPSWGSDNILDKFGPELSMLLIENNFEVIFRPHPIFFNDQSSNLKKIIELSKNNLLKLESPLIGDESIFFADILIGDYSGINLEFAALRNKPVISVDVKNKVANFNWKNLGLIPIEIKIRDYIGILVEPKINKILDAIYQLEENIQPNQAKNNIYDRFLFNKGKCSDNALKRIYQLYK